MTTTTADEPDVAPPARAGSAHPPTSPATFSHRQIVTILAGLMMGMFLAALDQTIVASAIRTIGDDLHGLSIQAWVTTAYLITSTITTPLYGKLSDLYGRRPLFLVAITLFVIGSAASAFSTSMYMLAAFRAFQGLGAGGLFSLALAIIGDVVAPRERAKYQGYFLAVFGTSSVLGPVVGGFFAGADQILWVSGWRWVFLVNVPVGLVALAVVFRTLHIPHVRRDHRIDYLGAALLVVGLVPLLTVLEQGRAWGWASGLAIGCYTVAAVGLVGFVAAEARLGDEALIPLRFFRDRMFALVSFVGVLTGVGMFGGLALLPLYLQIVKGATPTESGLLLLPLTAGIMVGSVFSGQLISRTGRYKVFPVLGTALMVVGMLLMHTIGADTPFPHTATYTAVFGFGLGNVMQPITLAVQNAMPPQDIGVATSSVTFFRQMGATIGTAVFLSLLFSTVGDKIAAAYRAAAGTPEFRAALRDPAVRDDPGNSPLLELLRAPGGGVSTSTLDDTSFLGQADPRLAHPFFVGFSQSMDQIFLIGAAVVAVAFVVLLFLREIPLRSQSAVQARIQDAAVAATEPVTAQGPAPEPAPEPSSEQTSEPAPGPSPEPPSIVSGRVLGPDGVVAVGAVVTLTDLAGRQVDTVRAGADGDYLVRAPAPGRYLLTCSATGFAPVAAAVELGAGPVRRNLAAAAPARVSGRVLSPAPSGPDVLNGSRPGRSGATVIALDAAGRVVAAATSGPDGRYELVDLPTGTYTLTVTRAGRRPVARRVQVVEGAEVTADVALPAGAAVTGVVRAASTGRPVGEATVSLLDELGGVLGTVVSGPDGRYRIDDLPPGTYTVVASGYAPTVARLEVVDGETRTWEPALSPGEGAAVGEGAGVVDLAVVGRGRHAVVPRGDVAPEPASPPVR